jgi:hypothetical protein
MTAILYDQNAIQLSRSTVARSLGDIEKCEGKRHARKKSKKKRQICFASLCG